MAHAHHFLSRLDRVTREQTEFALGLYRDDAAVRYVLEQVKLPPEAARVALAVDDPREGPFVLVTRDGKFVTCLGRGMHHEHPVVPRAQVDALLARVAEKRARREMAERDMRPDEDEDDVLARVTSRGMRLAREDYIAVTALGPFTGVFAWEMMRDIGLDATKSRLTLLSTFEHATAASIDQRQERALKALDRMEWAVAHLAVLAGAGERKELDLIVQASESFPLTPMYPCALQGGGTFLMRAAWATARLGRTIVPRYKRALAESRSWIDSLEAALGLGAIALRHSGSSAEIERILRSYGEPSGDTSTASYARAWAAQGVATALDVTESNVAAAVEAGRAICVAFGQNVEEGHPLRFAQPADVPEALARSTLLSLDLDTWSSKDRSFVLTLLPLAARASGEDFFLPRDVVRAWYGRWQPEEALARLQRIPRAALQAQPVRAAPSVGRNDPCTCGSGKKWKKCHGAPSRA